MKKTLYIILCMLILLVSSVSAGPINNSAIAYYKLESNLDDYYNSFNGINASSTDLISGKINHGRSFDGSSAFKTGINSH